MAKVNPGNITRLVIDRLRKKELSTFCAELVAYPIEALDLITSDMFLSVLLQHAAAVKAPWPYVHAILSRYVPVLGFEDVADVLCVVAGLFSVPHDTLVYLVGAMVSEGSPAISVLELLDHLIVNSSDDGPSLPIFGMVADRLIAAAKIAYAVDTSGLLLTGLPTGTHWKTMLATAERRGNHLAVAYLRARRMETAEVLEPPAWVSIRPDEYKLSSTAYNPTTWRTHPERVVTSTTLIDTNRQLGSIISAKDDEGEIVDADTMLELVTVALTTTPAGVVSALNKPAVSSKPVDVKAAPSPSSADLTLQREGEVKLAPPDPNRIFGPINAIVDRECPTGVGGGCRMLSCCCREFDQEDDLPFDGTNPGMWFDGSCDHCHGKITDISHAVRWPVDGGGWVGCFCSLEHMRLTPPRPKSKRTEMVMEAVFELLETSGIHDRARAQNTASITSSKRVTL